MLQSILSKPNWEEKINDIEIVNKWKTEIINNNLNPLIIDICIQLLKEYLSKKNHKYSTYNDDFFDF